jgi:hypothetical protein
VTVDQITALAQAGGLILLAAALLTGQVWAKPSVDFLRQMLTESLARETKLAEALATNTATMQEAMKELQRRPPAA